MLENSQINDILIIGAGPSGCAAAITAIKAGLSVTLVDKCQFPREKTCGDGLATDSQVILKSLNLYDKVKSSGFLCDKIEFLPANNKSFILNSPVITLKRKLFDQILFDEALNLGCHFFQGTFKGNTTFKNNHSEVEIINGSEKKYIKAKYVIFATGCHSSGSIIKAGFKTISYSDLVAIRGYYQADWQLSHPFIHFNSTLPYGYYWIFPMGNNEFNIGCGIKTGLKHKINLKHALNAFLENKLFLNKHDNVDTGIWLQQPKGALLRSNLSNRKAAVHGNMLMTGELLGSTFPFSGEGIGKAMKTGIIAAETVIQVLNNNCTLAHYLSRLENEIKPLFLPYKVADRFLAPEFPGNFLFSLLAKSNRLKQCTEDLLCEKIHPKQVFSLKGFWDLLKGPINS